MSKQLRIALILFCGLLPLYLLRFDILGIPTTVLECLFAILFLWWMVESRKSIIKKFKTVLSLPIVWPALVLILASTIAIFISPDTRSALGVWKAYFIEPFLFSILLFDALKTPKTKEWMYRSLGISAFIVSIYGLIQWFFRLPIPPPWDVERRITSIFPYPNALALFVGPIVVLAITQAWQTRKEKSAWKWVWLGIVLVGLIAIVLAKSEAAIASILLVTILFFLFQKSTRIATVFISVLMIVFAFSFSPIRMSLMEKFSFQDWSEQVRLSQWTETIQLLKDHPLFGVGLSGYPIALVPYHKATYLEIFQYPHNILLNIWVELGMLGVLSFLALLLMSTWKICTTKPFILVPAVFVLGEMFIHGLVDVPYFKNDLALLTWIFFILFVFESYGKSK